MADIDAVERLLCERYNVRALDGAEELAAAIETARKGDAGPLKAAIAEREMYRWHDAIHAALRADEGEPESTEEAAEEAEDDESFDSLTVPELRELAAERGIDLGDARLKADILAAIEGAN